MSMVYCMFGIAFSCIVWCPRPLPDFQALKAFRLEAMAFSTFHSTTRFHDAWGRVEPHTSSVVLRSRFDVVPDTLSGPISYTCRRAHMQVEDLLEMIACLRVSFQTLRPGVNLRLDFGGTSILMSHTCTGSWCCRASFMNIYSIWFKSYESDMKKALHYIDFWQRS